MARHLFKSGIRERFTRRDDLGHERLYDTYFRVDGLSFQCVKECLDFLEEEVGVPGGLMRPDDPLELLLQPPPTKNPWLWVQFQIIAGDIQGEIGRRLERQLKRGHAKGPRLQVLTFGDLTRRWCGAESEASS